MLTRSSLLVWAEAGLALCLYLIAEGRKYFSLHASPPPACVSREAGRVARLKNQTLLLPLLNWNEQNRFLQPNTTELSCVLSPQDVSPVGWGLQTHA